MEQNTLVSKQIETFKNSKVSDKLNFINPIDDYKSLLGTLGAFTISGEFVEVHWDDKKQARVGNNHNGNDIEYKDEDIVGFFRPDVVRRYVHMTTLHSGYIELIGFSDKNQKEVKDPKWSIKNYNVSGCNLTKVYVYNFRDTYSEYRLVYTMYGELIESESTIPKGYEPKELMISGFVFNKK